MADYKGRDAWDPAAGKKGGDGPSPRAELASGEFELGNLSVAEGRPAPAARPPSPSKLPWVVTVVVLIGAGAFAALVYWPAAKAVRQGAAELALAHAENAKLVQKLEDVDKKRAALESEATELQTAVQQKEQALNELQKTQEELAEKLQSEISKGDVLIKQHEGQIVVDLVDQILFNSGEATLNDQGKAAIRKVGETFLKIPDKVIQVGGHTDAVPIAPKLIDKFPSNWELSAARATNVVRFLQDEVKVPGARLVATGFSEYKPVGSNKTPAGRRKNRRIEVVLLQLPAGAAPAVSAQKVGPKR
jgi:chemotaxis protein MotB